MGSQYKSSTAMSGTLASQPQFVVDFDSKALNGLRGFASLHLVLHHAFWFCNSHPLNRWVMYGQVHMPLFFLLSGFCLTLGYGRSRYTRASVCCGKLRCIDACNCCRPIKDQQEASIFDTPKFLFNRLSRILPVFYICFIMAIVLTPTGHGNQRPDMDMGTIIANVESVFLVNVWLLGFFTANGPSWTVSTLFFFYLIYPISLVMAQVWALANLACYFLRKGYREPHRDSKQ